MGKRLAKLPHIKAEVQKLFDYPQPFAEEIFNQIERALHRCVADANAHGAAQQTGRLLIPEAKSHTDPGALPVPDLPLRYIGSSDSQLIAAHKARAYDERQLLHDRQEGMFMVSYQTSGGWVAISKDILTECLGGGHDLTITGLPASAAGVLRLMCPGLTGFRPA